jgi:hypothetical protein
MLTSLNQITTPTLRLPMHAGQAFSPESVNVALATATIAARMAACRSQSPSNHGTKSQASYDWLRAPCASYRGGGVVVLSDYA